MHDSHQKAAEYHILAAHAHRTAARHASFRTRGRYSLTLHEQGYQLSMEAVCANLLKVFKKVIVAQ